MTPVAPRLTPPQLVGKFFDDDGEPTYEGLQWLLFVETQVKNGVAPAAAAYFVAQANSQLTGDVNLGLLTSGFLSIVVALGVATPSASPTIAASVLTGPLPAISGAALTALTGAVVSHTIVAKTSTDTGYVPTADQTVTVDATGGATTIKLPTPSTVTGKFIIVKKIDASGNAVTVDGNGATIDGASTQALAAQWNAYTMQSNGANWFITGKV